MLLQHYTYYLLKIAGAGLLTLVGALSIILLIVALIIRFKINPDSRVRVPGFWLTLLVAVGLFVVAFSNATYEFDEQPETLVIEGMEGEPDCGSAWSGWIRGGYGMGNPCPKGCYRGKVLNKQMRMRGFPPWPQYRRELQCWARD